MEAEPQNQTAGGWPTDAAAMAVSTMPDIIVSVVRPRVALRIPNHSTRAHSGGGWRVRGAIHSCSRSVRFVTVSNPFVQIIVATQSHIT